jgi:hypothetical protein
MLPRTNQIEIATLLLSASAVAVSRPNETGFECALGIGVETMAVLGASCNDSTGCGDGPAMVGPRFGVRPGYVWPSGFGVAFNASIAVLSDGRRELRPGVMVFQATLASW